MGLLGLDGGIHLTEGHSSVYVEVPLIWVIIE